MTRVLAAFPLLLPLTLQPYSSRLEPLARALPHVSLVFVQATPKHDYDKEVLLPLRKAQAEAAEKARVAALAAAGAARVAAEQAAAVRAAQSVPAAPAVSYDGNEVMAAAGIAAGDYGFIQYIVGHEGSWCPTVQNGEHSYPCQPFHGYSDYRAYGICQALPGSKMAVAGDDWQTNPVTQMRWCSSYAASRYGSWGGAYAAWLRQNWW